MDLIDFNSNYLIKLLENISKEQKSIFLLGGCNVNLFNSFIPLILHPTRITG